jgi:hypothetical protein
LTLNLKNKKPLLLKINKSKMSHKSKKSKNKKMSKRVVIPMIAFAALIAISGMVGVSKANNNGDRQGTIIQKITERFNLNQSEVEEFFNQQRDERHQEKQAKAEENLNQAVADGKITEEQKSQILAKQEEFKNQRESSKDLSNEERKQKMTEHREEMKKWAEENGIDMKDIRGGEKGGLHGEGQKGQKAGGQNKIN